MVLQIKSKVMGVYFYVSFYFRTINIKKIFFFGTKNTIKNSYYSNLNFNFVLIFWRIVYSLHSGTGRFVISKAKQLDNCKFLPWLLVL